MVRPAKIGRSRGCLPCRKRRIKCDLTEPVCQRCVESGRVCPGPITGVLFITAEHTQSGKMRNKLVRSQAQQSSLVEPGMLPDLAYGAIVSKAPPIGPINEVALITRFFEFFSKRARRSSWTLKLPELKANPDAHALRASLLAVSLAYAAHVTKNDSYRYEAYQHYGRSLRRQQNDLLQSQLTINVQAAINALLAMVVLSYFELISGITPLAWLEHTAASEKLLVMLGPQVLQHEIIGQLFYSMRSHSVQRAAIHGQYSAFSEPQWMESNHSTPNPGRSIARCYYDQIVEFILKLSRYMYGYDTFPPGMDASMFLSELEHLYERFLSSRGLAVDDAPLLKPVASSEDEAGGVFGGSANDWNGLHLKLRKQFSAMSVSYFHAAAILFLSHLPIPGQTFQLEHNAKVIIAAGVFLSPPGNSNGTAALRMMLPFSSAWSFVPDKGIKLQARQVFQQWSTRVGLGGLCNIGFGQRQYQSLPILVPRHQSHLESIAAETGQTPWQQV